MKNKHLLFSLLALVIAGNLIILSTSWISKQKYTPRKDQNHKSDFGINGAVEYYNTIRNNPVTGDINPKWVIQAREDVDKLAKLRGSKSLGLTWTEVGPDNVGGRTRAILVDRNNSSILYAGGASGGLWKSTTGGSSWVQINDLADNLAISCITQAVDGAIYVGTGEGLALNGAEGAANGGTAFLGKGIYKSTDGSTFTMLPSTVPTVLNSEAAEFAFVNRMACDPVNANRVYASTNKGLRMSDDGGTSWINPVENSSGTTMISLSSCVQVGSDGSVAVSVGSKCYTSPNGNDHSFVLQSSGSNGDLPSSGVTRLELAIAPSDPMYIYASVAKSDGSLYNIYRSTDKGDTWNIIGPGGSSNFQVFGPNNQGWYDNTIAVHPTNRNKIFVGGVDMWGWEDGTTWVQKSLWYLNSSSSLYIHADQHTYVFDPKNSNIMYVGSDGGITRSTDCGVTFQTLNINYNTLQCYAVACSPTGKIMAGCQDNGTQYFAREGAFPKHSYDIKGGDGGWAAFSYINPEAYFATTYNGLTGRSPDAGGTFYNGNDASSPFFSARMVSLTPGSSAFAPFVTPLLEWESFNDTYSSDSITFTPEAVVNENMGKGTNGEKHFFGNLSRGGQASAAITPGSVEMISGTIYVTDNNAGILNQGTTAVGTIDYATGAYDVTFLTAPVNGANILGSYKVQYYAGSEILVSSHNSPGTFYYTLPNTIDDGDTIKIQDIIQSKFFLGATAGIWMTKQPLDFAIRPTWYKIANFTGSGTQCMAISTDGNYLFAGTSDGSIYRVSNIRAAQDSLSADVGSTAVPNIYSIIETKKLSVAGASGRAVTSIAIDASNANKVIITLGNYGYTDYVYYSSNALDSVPTFTSKQGNLPKMPVYTSLIPMLTSGTVVIGTEYGIYSTDNISSSSVQWTDENTGLAHVPVHMLRQQQFLHPGVNNYGTIYAGTHGRGVFECNKYTDIKDPVAPGSETIVSSPVTISMYPNPVTDNATLSFNINKTGDVKLKVYDMSGKVVKEFSIQLSKGYHTYTLDCSSIRNGAYMIQIVNNNQSATTKFIKNR